MTVNEILSQINQDKHTNPATTSDKFKTELWDFCKYNWPTGGSVCIEYGTHKGQTTRVLAHLFEKVYTCNLPNHFGEAMLLNKDLKNITYVGIDLYNSPIHDKLTLEPVQLFFIDAVHTHSAVMDDFARSMFMADNPSYVVFDDYGLSKDVYFAVNDLINVNRLKVIKEIGHEKSYDFKNGRQLTYGPEGLICEVIF